ncbi:MAG: branched-chain amino acid ABC transporter ATP-binding protein [Afipia sp. 62-7]|nr:ABC transporter ATP-binding protein [Alphaproteobacteria bacterium]OJU14680.1 MAG: branched-chain amino acid ABC transporter ATP-binding protein [Afipia sp. 62-7]
MLEVSNISVSHGSLQALWDVSFHVGKGERVGILGANGAGKSTTLGALMGLYPPSSGEIRLLGHPLAGKPPTECVTHGLALVPEGRRLFPEMSVRENLEMGAYLPAARRALAENIEKVYSLFPILKQKAGQHAGELSGGQQQMVAIGRALMTSPRILLLDEPFLGVAPLLVDEVMHALGLIAADGMTVVLVEQNIHRALDFVDRAYVIESGRIVLEGTRESLLGDTNFSNKFLGID